MQCEPHTEMFLKFLVYMFYLILYIPDSLIPTGNIKIIEMFYIFLILSLPNLVGNFTLIEHLTLN